MVAPPGRPMIKFVDIGGKYIDKHDRLARIKRWKHKGVLKARKREKNRIAREEAIKLSAAASAAAKEAALATKALQKANKSQQGTGEEGVGRSLVFS